MWEDRLCTANDAHIVRIHHLREAFNWHVFKKLKFAIACIIEQNIYFTIFSYDRIDRLNNLLIIGNIHLMKRAAAIYQ
ncbi:hypothetical protein D3C78_1714200 [compost metagenome]